MAPLVVRHGAAVTGERLGRGAPLLGGALPTMHEHHRLARTVLCVAERYAIVGMDETFHRGLTVRVGRVRT